MAVVTLLFEGVDKTKGVMDGFAVSLTSITDLVGGALFEALKISGAAMEDWVKDAMAGEVQQVALGNSVKLANDAIAEANILAANAVDVYSTATAGSAKEIAKLTEELEKKQKAMVLTTMRYNDLKNPTDAQTLAYQYQVEALQELEAELSAAQVTTTSVIKANHDLKTSFSVDILNEWATQFKDLAGGSDEAIVAIEQIGIKAGTVTAEQMPAFIQSVLDLGEVMGDNSTAALLLARAIDDPAAAMSKAQKAGILFSASLEGEVKALVKAGDMAGATALVTERLAKATAGAAAAGANTLSGKLEIMKNHLDDAGKAIGEALLPPLTLLFDNVIAPAIPIVEDVATKIAGLITSIMSFTDASGAIDIAGGLADAFYQVGYALEKYGLIGANDLFSDVGDGIITMFGSIQTAINDVVRSLQSGNIEGLFESVIGPIIDLMALMGTSDEDIGVFVDSFWKIYDALQNLGVSFATSLPMLQTYWNDMLAFLGQTWEQYGPPLIAGITNALTTLAQFWTDHGAQVMAIVNFAFRVIVETVSGALLGAVTAIQIGLNIIDGIFNVATELLKGNWQGAWDAIVATTLINSLQIISLCETFMAGVLNIVGMNLESFSSAWSGTFDLATIIITKFFSDLAASWSGVFSLLGTIISTFFSGLLTTWSGNWNLLVTIVSTVGTNISNAVSSWVSGVVASLKPLFDAINGAITGISSLSGMSVPLMQIPGRAGGGAVFAGNPYMVGENGPELFVPGQNGSIVNNYNLSIATQSAPSIPAEFGRAQAWAGAF